MDRAFLRMTVRAQETVGVRTMQEPAEAMADMVATVIAA